MKITHHSIDSYIKTLEETRKNDVIKIIELMQSFFTCPPKLWGSIIGFGHVRYQYPTGNGGIMPILSLASRKKAITLYLGYDLSKYKLDELGPVSHGKGCLYIKSLNHIDQAKLKQLFQHSKDELLKSSVIKEVIEQ